MNEIFVNEIRRDICKQTTQIKEYGIMDFGELEELAKDSIKSR